MKRGYIQRIILVLIVLIAGIFIVIHMLPENRLKRLIKQGNDYLLDQEYEKAVSVFDRALSIDSKNATAYFARGDAYAGLGETQKARLDYIRAEELNSSMAGAVEQKLSEMNAYDETGSALGILESDESESGADLSVSDMSAESQEEIIEPVDPNKAVLNREAMNAVKNVGDPAGFPSQDDMILQVVEVYNTYQASSGTCVMETSGPLTIYYSGEDGHLMCIMAPAGTYADHDNEFEHMLNAQYYYRMREDGSLEPSFIYLNDEGRTEEHFIYLWEGRVIRYVGPVDSSEYQSDYSPAVTIEEFTASVPQGVFAANAYLELQWITG
ncbi:MAG TPA: hypothetical protein DCG37_08880 [Lachnospiraceae bacterium]|nr:hypothetical protein [Lachnospiraceae bacterium]